MNFGSLLAAALGALLWAGPAHAQVGERLDEAALESYRGGLATPLGYDIGFGASVRTYVDGTLALETRLTWTAEGLRTDRLAESAATGVDLSYGGIPRDLGASIAAGSTRIIHDLTENRIASLVINTANDRTIRQETDITLHLPQFAQMQEQFAAERLASALQAAVGLAVRDAAGR